MIEIREEALELLTTDGYMRRFYLIVAERDCTWRDAYEQTEKEHVEAFRHAKYSTYASFKRVRSRWIKRYTPKR